MMRNFFLLLTTSCFLFAKAQCTKQHALDFQKKINEEYTNPDESPLTPADRAHFKSLAFYPVDMSYCVTAKLIRTPNQKPFTMATTTGRKPTFVKYGELLFTLKGRECKLDVFQDTELVKQEQYKDYLFLPFTDLTSGETSYGGGRYIDLEAPDGNIVYIDFNTAYNPYCAYNHAYSCPIPPSQNFLNVAVKAGVKAYKK